MTGIKRKRAETTEDLATLLRACTEGNRHGDLFVEEAKDKLDVIYEMQTKLDERITDQRNVDMSLDEWVVGLTIAMESEIDEIRREVNWKWWKNPKEVDKDALQGEVIDTWHFLLSLSRIVGLTPDDIHRVYLEKNAENHDRQDGKSERSNEGYGVKK